MTAAKPQSKLISVGRFVLNFANLGEITFSELSGITSKVIPQEYVTNDKGQVVHTRQFGKVQPPTIILKRGLDVVGNAKLTDWHALARQGVPAARGDGTLTLMDAQGTAQIVYTLHDAWCSGLVISAMKAGDSTVATIECTITCESIMVD